MDPKMQFLGLFRAKMKMTTIGIQNPKLNVTNDYQQILAHFDWFLSLFQISYVKPELSPVELKVGKNGIFWAKNLFKKMSQVFFIPQSKLCEKIGQKGPVNGFLQGEGFKSPPPN